MSAAPSDRFGTRERRRGLVRGAAAFVGVIVAGTAGFAWLEGWGAVRALYFTLITIATVGHGDDGISDDGRALAVALLVGGISISSYVLALAMEHVLASQTGWRKRMARHVKATSGHVIVCGFGRMGSTVADSLRSAGRSVVVVESREDAFLEACERGVPALKGSARCDEVLEDAGIERATHLVSAVDDELENMVVTLTARELRPDLPIIARSEQSAPMRELRQAGASHVVSPFRSGGAEVVGQILGPNPEDRGRRAFENEGDLIWAEVRVEEGAPLTGVSLESYGRRDDARVSFVALERPAKDRLIAPRGSEILLPGDVLVVAGHPEDVAAMCERARTQPD